jgi:hypothetical protein
MVLRKSFLGMSSVALLWLCAAFPARMRADQIIVNGGFETGDLTGWTVQFQSSPQTSATTFFVTNATGSLPSSNPTVGPNSGQFYAVSDAIQPSAPGNGAEVLYQRFTLPASTSVVLAFSLFANDYNSGPVPGGPLDFTTAAPNQYARVDILKGNADPFDTGSGVLLGGLYPSGVDPQITNPNPYTTYTYDITSTLGGGGTFILRFADVHNRGDLNTGVDDVSINFTPTSPNIIPEPGSVTLLALGLLGLFGYGWRRARN